MHSTNRVTIVMYHYVRDLVNSRFPEINGLDIQQFKEQIIFFSKNYNFISIKDLIECYQGERILPQKPILLTFDDNIIDHYLNVFPLLNEMNIQGAFYPSVNTEETLLDVHKIHFILAAARDKKMIIKIIFSYLDQYRSEFQLKPNDFYYNKYAKANREDDGDVVFIKRLLQLGLMRSLRTIIADNLFAEIVGIDQKVFTRELYMNKDHLKCMARNNMHIGIHGYDHVWLDSLKIDEQQAELDRSLEFLKSLGIDINRWTIAYPYGAFNEDTLKVLKQNGCSLAFTTVVDVADFNLFSCYELPRLDTNDLPKSQNASVNKWYSKS